MNAMIQHPRQQLRDPHPNATMSLGQHIRSQQKHCSHFGFRQWLADSGGMTAHQVALQRGQFFQWNPHLGQLAESGIDAVGRLAARHDRLDHAPRSPHPLARGSGEGDHPAEVRNPGDFFQRQGLAIQLEDMRFVPRSFRPARR